MKEILGKLILEDGSVFEGFSFGFEKLVSGEVVFNTGMVGYPETLTDPSYCGQIIVMTYPLIGNYGVPQQEFENDLSSVFESDRIYASGLIVSNYSENYSHWDASQSLNSWLIENKIPALQGIDTRELTKKLRDKGTMRGRIIFEQEGVEDITDKSLVEQVSVKEPIIYPAGKKSILLVDCGVKNSIIHAFLRRNITVLRVPYNYDFLSEKTNGIILSNGPGDPKDCMETIENTKRAITSGLPVLGICLGSQILGLASGANTYKLKFGHRGHNQPVNESGTKRCFISSQNHGYAIDASTLSEDWREWFTNDNDGTNEGIMHIYKPLFGAQFHPEASPGPDDTEFIFDMFVRAL